MSINRAMASTTAVAGSHVQVICRFRPLNAAEEEASVKGGPIEWFECSPDENEVKIRNLGMDLDFAFDRVFSTSVKQKEVFDSVVHVVHGVLEGFNGSLMAYGQTSSGKTHTMQGYGEVGIMPRALECIFQALAAQRQQSKGGGEDIESTVKLSYVEIYCEKIQDLLNPKKENLKIYENAVEGVAIQDVTMVPVANMADVEAVLREGQKNRATSATKMNAGSSRSHAMLQVIVTQANRNTQTTRRAKLMLVDLAGSERVGKTGVKGGARLEEAKNINRSLTTLGIVIRALADGSIHVPYRDSKLTRILQESLGGNSRTALVICCAPELKHAPETVSTLRFGERARKIAIKVKRNETLGVKELRILLAKAQAEIETLKAKLVTFPAGGSLDLTGSGTTAGSISASIDLSGKEPILRGEGEAIGGGAVAAKKALPREKVELVQQLTDLSMMVRNLRPLVSDVDDQEGSINDSPRPLYEESFSPVLSNQGSFNADSPPLPEDDERDAIMMAMTHTLALTGRTVVFDTMDASAGSVTQEDDDRQSPPGKQSPLEQKSASPRRNPPKPSSPRRPDEASVVGSSGPGIPSPIGTASDGADSRMAAFSPSKDSSKGKGSSLSGRSTPASPSQQRQPRMEELHDEQKEPEAPFRALAERLEQANLQLEEERAALKVELKRLSTLLTDTEKLLHEAQASSATQLEEVTRLNEQVKVLKSELAVTKLALEERTEESKVSFQTFVMRALCCMTVPTPNAKTEV